MMTRLTTSELREDLSTALNKVAFGGERITVTKNNKEVVALVSIEDLKLLRAVEDKLDRAFIKKAMEEPGPNIPWEEVKKEFGL